MRLTDIVPYEATREQAEKYALAFQGNSFSLFSVFGQIVDDAGLAYDSYRTNAVLVPGVKIDFLSQVEINKAIKAIGTRIVVNDFLNLLPEEWREILVPAGWSDYPDDPEEYVQRVKVEKYLTLSNKVFEHPIVAVNGDTIKITHTLRFQYV